MNRTHRPPSAPKAPLQARAARTRAAILEAGLRVAVRDGPQRFTTSAVALEGGISPGSIYRYFTDLNALLEEVIDLTWREIINELTRAVRSVRGWAPSPAAAEVVAQLTDSFERRAPLLRAVTEPGDSSADSQRCRFTELGIVLAGMLVTGTDAQRPRAGLQESSFVVQTLLVGTCRRIALDRRDGSDRDLMVGLAAAALSAALEAAGNVERE